MATATRPLPHAMPLEVDCGAPGCEAGKIKHQHARIHPDFIEKHLREHAYQRREGGDAAYNSKVIGADCNCPRVAGEATFTTCQACKGTGKKVESYAIPRANDRVKILDDALVEKLLGEIPDYNPAVYDVQRPEEHGLELRSGIGVRVTWDLTRAGKPRAGDITVWVFDLLEVQIVR